MYVEDSTLQIFHLIMLNMCAHVPSCVFLMLSISEEVARLTCMYVEHSYNGYRYLVPI